MSVEIDLEAMEARTERQLRQSGNSIVVTLPPQLLNEANLAEGDTVLLRTIFDSPGRITLEKTEEA